MIAAAPTFATTKLAGDEAEGVEAAALPDEEAEGEEPPLEALGADAEALAETLGGAVTLTGADDAALALTLPLALALAELAAELNGRTLGVALGPVGARPAVERRKESETEH